MTMDDAADLISRFFDGECSAEEAERLADLVSRDPQLKQGFRQQLLLDGFLSQKFAGRRGGDDFLEALQTRMDADKDATSFVKKVEAGLLTQGASSRPGTDRIPFSRRSRWRRSSGGPRSYVVASLVAAGILAGFILLLTLMTSGTATRPDRTVAERPRIERAPETPAQTPPTPVHVETPKASVPPTRQPVVSTRPVRRGLPVPPRVPPDSSERRPQPPAPAPKPRKPLPQESTRAAIASVLEIQGAVLLDGKTAVAAGQGIAADQSLRTVGPDSRAVLTFTDGTRFELRGDSSLEKIRTFGGKSATLARGFLRAVVTPQPRGNPLVMRTPHGRITVLGTTLTLRVDLAGTGSTRLDVEEGRVRLHRGAKSVTVPAGHYAVAGEGFRFAARRIPVVRTRTYTPVADGYVQKDSPTANFGTSTRLEVNHAAAPSGEQIAYLRFQIPGGGTVLKAVLKLTGVNGGDGIRVLTCPDFAWAESTITHASRPARMGPEVGKSQRVGAGKVVEIDVTRALSARPVFTLALVTDRPDGCAFRSREAAAGGPVLELTTRDPR